MESVSLYLKKFENLLGNEEIALEVVISSIKSLLGVDIAREDVKIKGNRIFITTSPILKNEIALHHEEILDLITKTAANKNIKRIS